VQHLVVVDRPDLFSVGGDGRPDRNRAHSRRG
jgi:hypothetical protein